MCGIFGFIGERAKFSTLTSVVQSALASLRRRGPDSNGYALFSGSGDLIEFEGAPPVGGNGAHMLLGQTRLSIIDLSDGGKQPMFSSDRRYVLVYNGEVYNYQELRKELESEGFSFRSQSDTEVVLNSLIAWGEDALLRFDGMFALAFYDSKTGRLFCARDYFGIKPFYWTKTEDSSFAFASELPTLLAMPGITKRVNWRAAYSFLYAAHVDVGKDTMIDGLYHLPPAHCMEIDVETANVLWERRYWTPSLEERREIAFCDAADHLRTLFLDSVKKQLRSDVPLGVALSGGIDSSSVVCAMRQIEPDRPIHTFSYIAADSPELSEEMWVDLVAKEVGATQHKVIARPGEMRADLDDMIVRQGEPFGSTSIYAQYRVFRLVHECGVSVTLDGQGADELMGGYAGYMYYRLKSIMEQQGLTAGLKFAYRAGGWPGRTRKDLIARALLLHRGSGSHFLTMLSRLVAKAASTDRLSWLDMNTLQSADAVECLSRDPGIYKTPDALREILAQHATWGNLPNLLRHGDRNSMTFSVESRVPFCTREIAEYVLSLPERYLIDESGCTKAVLRAAMRGIVPDSILNRRDKIGFATPEKQWFLGMSDWVMESLNLAKDSSIISRSGALEEWERIRSGSAPFDWRIWRMINYLRWRTLLNIKEY